MTRTLLVLGITLAAAMPARADLTHRISSSVQLDVGGASSRAVRVGNSYSISGSGVDTSITAGGNTTADALGDVTSTAAGTNTGLSGSVTTAGTVTIAPGGANTSAIGQVISELQSR